MSIRNLILRAETKPFEFRTPLIPEHISPILDHGFKIYVEPSIHRCFPNQEYKKAGAQMIPPGAWTEFKGPNSLIIGLKDFDYKLLDHHQHLYFSHLIKTQDTKLHIFRNTNSIIYDYEFLLDEQSQRLIAFGYYAGYTGTLLSVLAYSGNLSLPLTPWLSEPTVDIKNIKVAVIGPRGRCGQGALAVLNKYNIDVETFDRNQEKKGLYRYDIIVNSIYLSHPIKPFITTNDLPRFNKKTIIADISCDPSHPFNPLPIYNRGGTWNAPLVQVNENVSVLSLDNLPSLNPKPASIEFSTRLTGLLKDINNGDVWSKCLQHYFSALV